MGSTARLLIIGLLFHLVFILSVFDCYFTSPVVHGMNSFNVGSAEAKRLVLIVGDGLRADLLFEPNGFSAYPDAPEVVAPHLRSIVKTRGAFGISHTRVPTESRPGHVAIIGGMYEDVSAVAKGWKTNPVDFDSVFNQSSHTYSFGSPDILPMFTRGAVPHRVKEWSYDEDAEDFTQDATNLDIWVLEQLKTLFQNATSDTQLNTELRADRVVIFLHLLGLDTTGHSYRPHSPEYMNNIRVVDNIVQQTESLISKFYGDDDTSFIFTADHDPDSTRTPIIAWGKGVRGPLPDSAPSSHDAYSQPWGLGHLYRRDIEQADIAALMATLIGIDWPVNSVGVLPDVDPTRPGYLQPHQGDEMLAKAALVNAKVILENYRIQHDIKRTHKLLYTPFGPLEGHGEGDEATRLRTLRDIEELVSQKDWLSVRQKSLHLIGTGLEGLRYLQTYERTLLRSIATFAYIGWAAYASLFVFQSRLIVNTSRATTAVTIFASVILVGFWGTFYLERAPLTYYLYVVFPCYFWQQFFSKGYPWFTSSTLQSIRVRSVFSGASLVVGSLISMVLAYTHRSIWSIGFVVIGLVWPAVSWSSSKKQRIGGTLRIRWGVSCAIAAIFPLLSVDQSENLILIFCGGIALLTSAGYIFHQHGPVSRSLKILYRIQVLLIVLAMVITTSSVRSLQAKTGLPWINQISGWIVFTVSSLLPFVSRVSHSSPTTKILMTLLGLGPCFIILAISVEGLFFAAYSITLLAWVDVEAALRPARPGQSSVYHFQADDLRIVLFFLFFIQVGFFGTGNVASISSFYLSPVYRLIPVFNPFYMAALLTFKIVAPYLILALTFATLTYRLHLPPFALFLNALMLTDGMTLTFFFNVTDTGSWLEIGQTISFFVVTSLLLLWSGGICAIGEYMITAKEHTD
ncbi:Phosphatidylinositolglycan class N-domain-containing protein [Mucidula mucida]|nr:Phosphatidylinositolglycan class N-domain-containing protein [Mucidula mucida]